MMSIKKKCKKYLKEEQLRNRTKESTVQFISNIESRAHSMFSKTDRMRNIFNYSGYCYTNSIQRLKWNIFNNDTPIFRGPTKKKTDGSMFVNPCNIFKQHEIKKPYANEKNCSKPYIYADIFGKKQSDISSNFYVYEKQEIENNEKNFKLIKSRPFKEVTQPLVSNSNIVYNPNYKQVNKNPVLKQNLLSNLDKDKSSYTVPSMNKDQRISNNNFITSNGNVHASQQNYSPFKHLEPKKSKEIYDVKEREMDMLSNPNAFSTDYNTINSNQNSNFNFSNPQSLQVERNNSEYKQSYSNEDYENPYTQGYHNYHTTSNSDIQSQSNNYANYSNDQDFYSPNNHNIDYYPYNDQISQNYDQCLDSTIQTYPNHDNYGIYNDSTIPFIPENTNIIEYGNIPGNEYIYPNSNSKMNLESHNYAYDITDPNSLQNDNYDERLQRRQLNERMNTIPNDELYSTYNEVNQASYDNYDTNVENNYQGNDIPCKQKQSLRKQPTSNNPINTSKMQFSKQPVLNKQYHRQVSKPIRSKQIFSENSEYVVTNEKIMESKSDNYVNNEMENNSEVKIEKDYPNVTIQNINKTTPVITHTFQPEQKKPQMKSTENEKFIKKLQQNPVQNENNQKMSDKRKEPSRQLKQSQSEKISNNNQYKNSKDDLKKLSTNLKTPEKKKQQNVGHKQFSGPRRNSKESATIKKSNNTLNDNKVIKRTDIFKRDANNRVELDKIKEDEKHIEATVNEISKSENLEMNDVKNPEHYSEITTNNSIQEFISDDKPDQSVNNENREMNVQENNEEKVEQNHVDDKNISNINEALDIEKSDMQDNQNIITSTENKNDQYENGISSDNKSSNQLFNENIETYEYVDQSNLPELTNERYQRYNDEIKDDNTSVYNENVSQNINYINTENYYGLNNDTFSENRDTHSHQEYQEQFNNYNETYEGEITTNYTDNQNYEKTNFSEYNQPINNTDEINKYQENYGIDTNYIEASNTEEQVFAPIQNPDNTTLQFGDNIITDQIYNYEENTENVEHTDQNFKPYKEDNENLEDNEAAEIEGNSNFQEEMYQNTNNTYENEQTDQLYLHENLDYSGEDQENYYKDNNVHDNQNEYDQQYSTNNDQNYYEEYNQNDNQTYESQYENQHHENEYDEYERQTNHEIDYSEEICNNENNTQDYTKTEDYKSNNLELINSNEKDTYEVENITEKS